MGMRVKDQQETALQRVRLMTGHEFSRGAYPEFRRWVLPRIPFFFELSQLLSQDLSVIEKVIQMASGFLSADHHLDFICKPILEEKMVTSAYGRGIPGPRARLISRLRA